MELLQSTAYTRMFLMIDTTDHISGKSGASPAVTLSKAGGAFAAAGGTVTEVSSGWYKIVLTTTDVNTLGDLAFHITGTGADPTDFADKVVAATAASLVVPTAVEIRQEMDNNSADLNTIIAALGAGVDLTPVLAAIAAVPANTRSEMDTSSADLNTIISLLTNLGNVTLNSSEYVNILNTLFAGEVETGLSFVECQRLLAASQGGRVIGGGTNAVQILSWNGLKTRIQAVVDSAGNRISFIFDLS